MQGNGNTAFQDLSTPKISFKKSVHCESSRFFKAPNNIPSNAWNQTLLFDVFGIPPESENLI